MPSTTVKRSRRQGPDRNTTFSLHPEALHAIEALMAAGRAPSKNALIEELVLREWRRQARADRDAARLAAYRAAMNDPLFVGDLETVADAFAAADAETARMIDE